MHGFEYFGTQAHLIYFSKCCHKNYLVVTTIRVKVKSLNKKILQKFLHPFSSSSSTSVKFNRFFVFLDDKTFLYLSIWRKSLFN